MVVQLWCFSSPRQKYGTLDSTEFVVYPNLAHSDLFNTNPYACVYVCRAAIPSIHAPTSFENGVLKSIKIEFSGPVKRNQGRRKSMAMEQVYGLELKGTVLPHSVLRLNAVLNETQDGQFDAVLEKADNTKMTVALNCTPHVILPDDAGEAPPVVNDTMHDDAADPVLAELQKAPHLGRKMVTQLHSTCGLYAFDLTRDL